MPRLLFPLAIRNPHLVWTSVVKSPIQHFYLPFGFIVKWLYVSRSLASGKEDAQVLFLGPGVETEHSQVHVRTTIVLTKIAKLVVYLAGLHLGFVRQRVKPQLLGFVLELLSHIGLEEKNGGRMRCWMQWTGEERELLVLMDRRSVIDQRCETLKHILSKQRSSASKLNRD